MPVIVVATMKAKPESVDTVRDACKQAIEAVHSEPGCDLYSLHEADGTFVFVEQWADADALKTHSTAPRCHDPVRHGRRASRRRPRHQDAATGRRGRSGQGSAASVMTCARRARSRSSPAPPAVRAVPRRSGWRPTAPTSSRSTSATRSRRFPTRWPPPTIWRRRSSSSRTPVRESSPSRPTFAIRRTAESAAGRARRVRQARHRRRQRGHRADGIGRRRLA